MIQRALNQKTAPHLGFAGFLDLARSLGCVGVEARNDLGRPFFDGNAPYDAGRMARERGLRLLGLSEVYPFNDWTAERESEIHHLIKVAAEAGAESVSLIPRVDGAGTEDGLRQKVLREVMREIFPMLNGRDLIVLVEPIGFSTSSLRRKAELVDAIEAVGGATRFKLVHDTFQHAIAGETEIFAPWTHIVHISGISDPGVALNETQDAHRVLIDRDDRCGNVEQISALLEAGFFGAFSFECTDPSVQTSAKLEQDIHASFSLVESLVCS